MKKWYIELFENDIEFDIKEEYINYLKDGLSESEADRNVIKNNEDIISLGDNEALEFWVGLAIVEWEYGRLQETTKKIAIRMLLDKKADINFSNERIYELEKIIKKIQSKQPLKKKIKNDKAFNCIWNIGDVYAYQLKSQVSKNKRYSNKYIIFQKVGESKVHHQNIIPIIRVANKIFDNIPLLEDYLNSEKIIWFGSPNDYKKKNLVIYRDTFLYDKKMFVKSFKSYPKNIIYIGNSFPIKKEYKEGKLLGESYLEWKEFEETFFEFYEKWLNIDRSKYI